MYQLPQEIEAKFIIPAIRRDLSKHLSKDHKISYDKIGKLLGITKAAVSQYLSEKRAAKIKLHPEVDKEVKKSGDLIFKSNSNSVKEILRILSLIKKNKYHCEVCGKKVDGKLHDCKQIVINYNDCNGED